MKKVDREEMIERLVEDRFSDWVWAANYDGLEEALREGFTGFEEYTDDELKKANDELLPENIEGMHHQKHVELYHEKEEDNG